MVALASLCLAPIDADLSSVTASFFGKIAETTISRHYLRHRGKPAFFPLSTTDFEDITAGWRNVELYLAFLKMNNPKLSVSQLLDMRKSLRSEKGSLTKIPDIMTHDGELREFYEIKPNNPDGVTKGVDKIANIKAFLDFFGLRSYGAGIGWKPDTKILLFEGHLPELLPTMSIPVKIKVFFHFKWLVPGLVVYEICVEPDLALEELVIKAIAAAIVLVIVFGPEILAAIAAAGEVLIPILTGAGGALVPATN